MMKISTALKLGRVSNLPTVWSNCIAGAALSTMPVLDWRLAVVLFALSLSYIGGMFLNDAFDARIDAKERSERPIPSGEVSRKQVFTWGFFLLGASVLLLLVAGILGAQLTAASTAQLGGPLNAYLPALAGIVLAALIVLYNVWHKNNPISPFIMGLCRVAVYVAATLVYTSVIPVGLWVGALMLLCHLVGLTYIAKQENLGSVKNLWPLLFLFAPMAFGVFQVMNGLIDVAPYALLLSAWVLYALYFVRRRSAGDIPKAVVSLIAGIALLDAMLAAGTGQHVLAVICLLAFAFTLFLQRYIAGT